MKRTIIFAVLVLGCMALYAQTSEKSSPRRILYHHAVEVTGGYSLLDGYSDVFQGPSGNYLASFRNLWGVGIHELHGVQFNPHFSLAVVVGADFRGGYPDAEDYHSNHPGFAEPYPGIYILDFSLGLNFKYTILKNHSWSPYLAAEFCPVSASFSGLVHPTYKSSHLDRRGSLNLGVGAQYRFGDRQSVYAALGYEIVWSQLNLTVGVRIR